MRLARTATALTVSLLIAATGCAREITGVAVAPAGTTSASQVALSADGYGIRLGKPAAAAQIDIYIEPQCPHCADFERQFGDELARNVADGNLTVTYRPLTFIDYGPPYYSAHASNALFLAAQPDAGTSAPQIFGFLQALYKQVSPFGSNPDDAGIAAIARTSGLPSDVADRIAADKKAIDADAMSNANSDRLAQVSQDVVGTPTVYDTRQQSIVDIDSPNWIAQLIKST
jgi:protein-disulfide isomerase